MLSHPPVRRSVSRRRCSIPSGVFVLLGGSCLLEESQACVPAKRPPVAGCGNVPPRLSSLCTRGSLVRLDLHRRLPEPDISITLTKHCPKIMFRMYEYNKIYISVMSSRNDHRLTYRCYPIAASVSSECRASEFSVYSNINLTAPLHL